MKEGYRKIWLWLALMMLVTVVVGGSYYFGTMQEADYESEGTLVEREVEDAKELAGRGVKTIDGQRTCKMENAGRLAGQGMGEEVYGC